MNILSLINIIVLISIILECIYSFYKKDGGHSFSGTSGNILRAIVSYAFQKNIPILILLYTWLELANKANDNVTIKSFIFCLLILDLSRYLLHKANHHFSFLWALHSVHHSDKNVNLSTSYRVSWFEQIYSFLIIIPLVLLDYNFTIIAFSLYIMGIHSLFCHNCYINLPRFVDHLFITPENHRVHHDEHMENQNSNYGNLFSIWDRMFGTFVRTKENIVFGIKGYHQDNFIKMETEPIIDYVKKLRIN